MSKDPWIGDPSDAPDGTCVFALEPGDPHCGQPASVHILAESAIYGLVGLVACDVHAPVARNTGGPVIGEHPYGPGCVGQETWWREDGCVRSETSGAAS